jgi:hypothetical protein
MIFNIKTTTLIILQCEKTLYSKIKVSINIFLKSPLIYTIQKTIIKTIKYVFNGPKKVKNIKIDQ